MSICPHSQRQRTGRTTQPRLCCLAMYCSMNDVLDKGADAMGRGAGKGECIANSRVTKPTSKRRKQKSASERAMSTKRVCGSQKMAEATRCYVILLNCSYNPRIRMGRARQLLAYITFPLVRISLLLRFPYLKTIFSPRHLSPNLAE